MERGYRKEVRGKEERKEGQLQLGCKINKKYIKNKQSDLFVENLENKDIKKNIKIKVVLIMKMAIDVFLHIFIVFLIYTQLLKKVMSYYRHNFYIC